MPESTWVLSKRLPGGQPTLGMRWHKTLAKSGASCLDALETGPDKTQGDVEGSG